MFLNSRGQLLHLRRFCRGMSIDVELAILGRELWFRSVFVFIQFAVVFCFIRVF